MKISTILDYIDSGHIALPEFQRGYVWSREQVRGLFDSLYRRHPVGTLLVWATEAKVTSHRGDGQVAAGIVKLLLDGQQRITSLYGVARGRPPQFFDGDANAFTGLMFHLEQERFAFYMPMKMKDDPLWVDVTALMQKGYDGIGDLVSLISTRADLAGKLNTYTSRISRVLGILDVDLHTEELSQEEKSLDVVVDIFNRVNSGGTKLSKGDLALAKICADWPEARKKMQQELKRWSDSDYHFNLDWLLRCVNTVLTGEAKFHYLHDIEAQNIQHGLKRAVKTVDQSLNLIADRLGLDHDRVLFGRFAIPVMSYYLDKRNAPLDATERDKLLFWFLQAGMWGRFSGSTETKIDQDLEALEPLKGGLDRLLEQMRLWHGAMAVEPGHFVGWGIGARFYPVLYLLTRVGEARDWGTGLPLKKGLLGKHSRLEVHHIFPKKKLYDAGYKKPEVNAVANYCFLTKDSNLKIKDRSPQEYFQEIEEKHPGALASQWIPEDRQLWQVDNYLDFLEARKKLLANAINDFMKELLHEDTRWLETGKAVRDAKLEAHVYGGVDSEEDEQLLQEVNDWIAQQGLPRGHLAYEISDEESGEQLAVLDLAWPEGIQEGLSQPVAILLDDVEEVLATAASKGFRCFKQVEAFKRYVAEEIMAEETATANAEI